MKKACVLLTISSLFFLICNTGVVLSQVSEETAQTVTLYVGQMKAVSANIPTRVVIGNPNVADIISVTTKEIILAGKGSGRTNLIWWDSSGENTISVKVLAEDMSDMKSRIDVLLKELNLSSVFTRNSDSEGKVLLLGTVRAVEDISRIKTVLGSLYLKTSNLIQIDEEKAIVELDVEVLEVNKDATKELGIRWFDTMALTEPARWEKKLATVPDAMFRVTEWTRNSLGATLDLLVKQGAARILSRPRLACQSGKEAELLVGGEKPIMTTQTVSGGGSSTTVDYKEYGIKLKMAPVVNENKKIKLTIKVDVTDIQAAEILGPADAPTARAYPLLKRNTSTQLYLDDGQTLSISGLIRQKTEEDLAKFPWLGDVPVLGLFFRHRSTKQGGGSGERGDTELVILVTPSIVVDKKQVKETAKEEKETVKENIPVKELPKKERAKKISKEEVIKESEAVPEDTKVALAKPESPDLKKEALIAYVQEIAGYIADRLDYPWAARQGRIEGALRLALHLSDAGELLDINISDSSGFSVLDENALRIAKQISPYPSFPRGITEKDLWMQVPIVYNLKE